MSSTQTGIADYEFLEELGSGNYGVFWRARPPARLGLDVDYVAVKVLHHRSGEQGYTRMVNELRVYRAAASPHLVPIYDAGQQGGVIYYAAEYSERGSLANHAVNMERQEKLRAIAEVAKGVQALHEVGVAHRDIKPSNMMLFDNGAKLADLGLAQILNPGQTSTGGGPVGSIAYQAPEMVRGETATRATDIFALGGALHTILCGSTVFPGIDGLTLKGALRFMLHPEASVHPTLTPDEAALVRACSSLDPAYRPSTAEDFANAVENLLVEAGA